MSYLKAVLNDDTVREERYLKELVYIGKRLHIDTHKYKQELKKFTKSNKIISKTKIIQKPITVTKRKKERQTPFNIHSVYTKENQIVINFTHNITSKHIKFFEQHYRNLHKDVFHIRGNFKDAKPTKLKIQGLDKITISQYSHNVLKITLSNKINPKTIFIINKKQIIIKVLNLNKKNKTQAQISKNIPKYKTNNRNKTIVIDAGHGGKDVGAVGPKRRYEKIVVLKIAKYLHNYLKQKGYRVYITRANDKFIKVNKRTVLANKKKADIFISVHANAAHKTKLKTLQGIETFFLSPARSARAKRVAEKENKSDIRKMNYSSKNTLLTILNQSKITQSNKLAIDVQQNMLHSARKLYKNVVDGGVREGPFWVLVGAQMPSILVEVGYISHPTESVRLYNTNYQKKLALGIANGVDSYFVKNP